MVRLLLLLLASPLVQENEGASRGVVVHEPGAFAGYTLISPMRSKETYLIDMRGEIVHHWKSKLRPGKCVYLLDDGHLLRACRVRNSVFGQAGPGGRIQELTWDGEMVWDFEFSTDRFIAHHDIEPLPDGNVLVIAWELLTRVDAIGAGRDPEQTHDDGFWPDFVVEIRPVPPDGGEVVWEWHAFDHLIQDFDPSAPNHGVVAMHPERIDVNADHRYSRPVDREARERREELEHEMRELGYAGDDEEVEADARTTTDRRAGDWLHTNESRRGLPGHADPPRSPGAGAPETMNVRYRVRTSTKTSRIAPAPSDSPGTEGPRPCRAEVRRTMR